VSLPPQLLVADEALHKLLVAARFSPHLNPVNVQEARQAFAAGARIPPFRYAPLPDAPGLLTALDAIRCPPDHPLGVELQRAVDETRATVRALERRDAASFRHLADLAGWLPTPGEASAAPPETSGRRSRRPVAVDEVRQTFRAALAARGLDGWRVEDDPVMASRVLVDAPRLRIRLNPAASFCEGDLAALVAHEIDVHVRRAHNGARQPLRLFSTGLCGSLVAEEGLAVLAEERLGLLPEGFGRRQRMVVGAVLSAYQLGFRELFETLRPTTGSGTAWSVALRVKRGLARPDLPGAYGKDAVYWRGWLRARALTDDEIDRLYVGKVGLEHPVDTWMAAGWLRPTTPGRA
jgi:hypothetical protein